MPLRSALEDFESTSLGAIPGLLGKLRYLAELYDGRGGYSHWGLARVHGELAAGRAMRTSHAAVLASVLRTPLRVLADELTSSAGNAHLTPAEFLASLESRIDQTLPDRTATPAERHLKAVLHALSALSQSQAGANHPDASPPRPPAR